MTQEELDALMTGGLDDLEEETIEDNNIEEELLDEIIDDEATEEEVKEKTEWPPAPSASEEHRVVGQLDDVTKESELKATEIFDKLDSMSELLANITEESSSIVDVFDSNIDTFKKLSSKFPNVSLFKEQLETNEKAKEKSQTMITDVQASEDEIMMIMDIMQYQDIHRQKIERVINVMRALTKYMNVLFSGKIADENRVSSAQHIAGDDTETLVDDDELEALIANFGAKE